ncbi:MAG: carboxypeptidase regulatory-like domain-containing protein [Planctomycetota bacterium]|nr:MAG: carboxypeptidase regulatory-like domain-containing protein [Planctomycetota bacterium]
MHDKQSARAVPDATLRLYMLRRGDEPGSAYFWPEHIPAEAVTDASGTARLRYPAWVAGAGLTSKVAFVLKHPEYPSREEEVEITGLSTEHSVELEYGCYLVVSGWVGDPTHAVYDVTVKMDDEAKIQASDWIAGRDGRLATNRAKAGPHALSIAWVSPQQQRYESRVVEFALTSGEQRELSLELLPTLTLRGRFDDAVPRPIANGAVMIAVAFGGSRAATSLRAYRTDVASDGRFEIAGLPHGRAEVIAICDGWSSTGVRIAATEELDYERDGNQEFELPRESELVIAMQPTAAVELEVVDEGGAPIAEADFAMWPNVHWDACGYSTFFLERQWSTQTDSSGHARLENLPVKGSPCREGYSVGKRGWLPVGEARDESAAGEIELEPGRTASLRVVMKPKAD